MATSLLTYLRVNLGPAHISSTRRAGTRRAERWLSRCRPTSRRPRTRTTPGKPPASSTLGSVHTWAGDVGLGTPAVVGPRRSPRLACSPSRAAEITLAPGCIKPGPVNRDRDFVCATPTPRRHAPRGMQLISGSARAFKLGFRSRSSAVRLRWTQYVIFSVFDCFISSRPRRRSRHHHRSSCDGRLQTPILRRPRLLWILHRHMSSAPSRQTCASS